MDQVYYMCTILLHRHLSALTAHDLHDFCIVIGVNTRVMMFFFRVLLLLGTVLLHACEHH